MGLDWVGDGMGWDLCAGLFYEHRFAMLIISIYGGTLYTLRQARAERRTVTKFTCEYGWVAKGSSRWRVNPAKGFSLPAKQIVHRSITDEGGF